MEINAKRICRIPGGLRRRAHQRLNAMQDRRRLTSVPIEKLLMGGEYVVIPAEQWARMTNEFLRPSTPVAKGPHAQLLRQYQKMGEDLFCPDVLKNTAYYKNVFNCIDILGRYFDATQPEHIQKVAERFAKHFSGKTFGNVPLPQKSPEGAPIRVRPIAYSTCYEVVDGHHRVAMAAVRGEKEITVLPRGEPAVTPLQKTLLEVLWEGRRKELYQPIDAPELADQWKLVRKCTDRLDMMRQFLDSNHLMPPQLKTYVDIGANYGWFIAQTQSLGFDSYGVERDPLSANLGQEIYGNRPEQIFRSDCMRFLGETEQIYDVVSCFSVLHHFVLGRGSSSPEELIQALDKRTGKVLFLDTGQNHEAWFGESLKEWSADFIEQWLQTNTSFNWILRLGVDQDAVPPFENNYGRTLFACIR